MMIWGFNSVAVKLALRELDPLAFTLLRNSILMLVLLGIFLATERRWAVRRADIVRILLIGIAGYSANQLFFSFGTRQTTAANASLLMSTSPIFGLLLAILLDGERVTARRWLGVASAMAGVALIIAGGQNQFRFSFENIVGDLLIVGAAASWALYSVLGRPVSHIYSPLRLTTYGSIVGICFLTPLAIGSAIAQPWSAVSGITWAVVLYSGIFVAISWVLWYGLINKVGSSRSLVFMYLMPVFGVIAAIFVLNESLSLLQVGGAIVALIGVNVARKG